jgi:hydroxypyruvate reductase
MELALGAAPVLAGHDHIALVAFATDGDDGSSAAAGALVDSTTCARARAIGCDLDAAIAASATAPALACLGDLLVTGPTRTNVCDVVAIVAR